jgi:hypothetical protein
MIDANRTFLKCSSTAMICVLAWLLPPAAPGQTAKQAITLDPPTGADWQAQNFDRNGQPLGAAPENARRLGEAKTGEPAELHTLTLRFTETTKLTSIASTRDFPLEQGGSCVEGRVFAAGATCSLLVRFTPQGPGHRLGHVTIGHSASAKPFSITLTGTAFEPTINFVPSIITTVPGSYPSSAGLLSGAHNLTVDGGDTLYVADTGNDAIRSLNSSGSFTSLVDSDFYVSPLGIAVDTFGEVYFDTPPSNILFEIYDYGPTVQITGTTTGACTSSAPCTLESHAVSNPGTMSMDANNNLFFADEDLGAAMSRVQPTLANLVYLSNAFPYQTGVTGGTPIAVDTSDNIYSLWANGGDCEIVQESLYDAENGLIDYNKIAGGRTCGFSGDGGLAGNAEIGNTIGQFAFDAAGNLYFSDNVNQRVRRVDAETGIIRTIAGNGTAGYAGDSGQATSAELSSPTGVAVDSRGQVYIISSDAATGTSQVIREVGQTGYLNLGPQAINTSGTAQTVLVTNTGNNQMVLTEMVINGANPGDFAVDPNTTTCDLAAQATLDNGLSCRIGIIFTPKASGTRTANLVLLDNTVTGNDTVILNGTGTLATPALAITSPKLGQTYASGSTLTFTVTVTGVSGLPTPTGTVKFGVDGVVQGSPVALSSGSASVTISGLATGSNSLTASYSGDSNYAAAGPIGGSINISAPAVTRVSLARESSASQSCENAGFAVEVLSRSPVRPTGKIELMDGTKMLASGTLVDGKVTLKAALKAGTNATLVAHYLGDKHHLPSESAVLKLTTSKTAPCEVR